MDSCSSRWTRNLTRFTSRSLQSRVVHAGGLRPHTLPCPHSSCRDLLPYPFHVTLLAIPRCSRRDPATSLRHIYQRLATRPQSLRHPHCGMCRDFWTNRQGSRMPEHQSKSCTKVFPGKTPGHNDTGKVERPRATQSGHRFAEKSRQT